MMNHKLSSVAKIALAKAKLAATTSSTQQYQARCTDTTTTTYHANTVRRFNVSSANTAKQSSSSAASSSVSAASSSASSSSTSLISPSPAPSSSSCAASTRPFSFLSVLNRISPPSVTVTDWSPSFGVFGCHLRSPSDFLTLTRAAIAKCDGIIAMIESEPPSRRTLELTDEISNTICSVLDVASLCSAIHPSFKWRSAGNIASGTLSDYMVGLNHSQSLYRSICALPLLSDYASWPSETKRVCMLLRRDMDAQGVGASAHDRDRIQSVLAAVHDHQCAFGGLEKEIDLSMVGVKPVRIELTKFDDLADITGVITQEHAAQMERKSGSTAVSFPLSSGTHLLQNLCSSDLRQEVYEQYYSVSAQRIRSKTLESLIESRQQLSDIIGHASFAQHAVSLNVARDSEHVKRVLLALLKGTSRANPRAEAEVISMKCRKYLDENELVDRDMPATPFDKFTPEEQNKVKKMMMHPWDAIYYKGRIQSEVFKSATSTLTTHFFTMTNIIKGYKILCDRLFNIDLKEVPMAEGEAWVDGDQIRKLELWDRAKGDSASSSTPSSSSSPAAAGASTPSPRTLLGVIYVDAYTRADKYPGAATFTIRSGCDLIDPATGRKSKDMHQPAIVAIVASLTKPQIKSGIHRSQGNTKQVAMFRVEDVEMMFHEFGHCLHNVLSLTSYHHVSGARGELDFVEFPSTLFEYFVTSYPFVKLWATHYATNATMPEYFMNDIIKSKTVFAHMNMATQAMMSLFDQEAHGVMTKDGDRRDGDHNDVAERGWWTYHDRSSSSSTQVGSHLDRVYASIQSRHSLYELDPSAPPSSHHVRPFVRWGHLGGYAGGYYCYLYCRILSSIVWSKYFANDTMNRQSGMALREKMFARGGSTDPINILSELAQLPNGGKDGELQRFVEAQVDEFIKMQGTKQGSGACS